MATTVTYSGSASISVVLSAALSGEKTGSELARWLKSITFAAAGGTAPTLAGFMIGDGVAAAGDILLAHATDPLQGMGSANYSEGFDPAGDLLKILIFENLSTTTGQDITVTRGAANGLEILSAAGDAFLVKPGGFRVFYDPVGLTAALVSGGNDKLTLAVAAGSPGFRVLAGYGP
jgi:hypothetical protein